jgi:HAD superfamily hydrolase (TIGR01509 family)
VTRAHYSAVIFDLDGVLWDGEPLYHEAFNVVLKPRGFAVTAEEYEHIIGHSVEAAWAWVLKRFDIDEDPAPFYQAYDAAVLQLLEKPVEPIAGVRDLMDRLHARGIPVGLASASLRHWVDATLVGIGLAGRFDTTVAAGEVPHAKPAPDLYLKAAENLRVDPQHCIAVEDTPSGVKAAKAAGMYVIQVRAASTALAPIPQADAVIEDYSQFDLALLA